MKSSRPQSREVTGRFWKDLRLCSSSHDSVASWAQRVREAQLHAALTWSLSSLLLRLLLFFMTLLRLQT